MSEPQATDLTAGAVATEAPAADQSTEQIETSPRVERFRAAYEALIEPLVNATIKIAEAEAENERRLAQVSAVESLLAETTATLAMTKAERDRIVSAIERLLAERDRMGQELQSVYASYSWRMTAPLRRLVKAAQHCRIAASARATRSSEHLRLAFVRMSKFASGLRDSAIEALSRPRGSVAERDGGLLGFLARFAGWWRLSWSRPRTMWGVTPILTLPLLAKCDRLLGLRSESLVFTTYHTTSAFDINLRTLSAAVYGRYPRWVERFHRTVLQLGLIRYDVFHTFCDRGLLPASLGLRIEPDELRAIRGHGRRLYAYTYGADVRTRAATLALGRYNLCVECPEPGRFCTCDDAQGARNIETIQQHATAVVSMGDMLAYAPDARNLHYWPIDTAKFDNTSIDWPAGRPLRIGHAPNHAHFKGTRYLVSAIERLQAQGYAIELVSATGIANSDVIALFKSCDIVADQFIAGFHGYTALEAMALGKPVLCYLRNPDMVIDPANCPILNCSPDALEDVLRGCFDGEFDLIELGRRSRSYVEHYYSLEAVAIRLGQLYLETAAFPDRVNRMIDRRISELKARLPQLVTGAPPVPWHLAEEPDHILWHPAKAVAR